MTRWLASVCNLVEAEMALAAQADIIDLKNPAHGALGALSLHEVQTIAASIDRRRPLSATIGDLPLQPETVIPAVQAMAATGVDYVKIGFFAGEWHDTLAALQVLTTDVNIVAVLFANDLPDFGWIEHIAAAGLRGVMLDTRNKTQGSLRTYCSQATLSEFVDVTRKLGLLCGLAGSLRLADIPSLLPLQADYLGFRGALCGDHDRQSSLCSEALQSVRQALRAPVIQRM